MGNKITELFDNLLEEDEFTETEYLEFQHFSRLNAFIARQLLKYPEPVKNILIVRPQRNFTELVLKKLGYDVETIDIQDITSSDNHCLVTCALKRQKYDIVMLVDILEHLVIHPKYLLSSLEGLIDASGSIIIASSNIARFGFRIKMLFGKNIYPWLEDGCEIKEGRISAPVVVRQFTLKETLRVVTDAQLTVKKRGFFLHSPAIEMIPMSLGYYFARHFNYLIMMLVPPFRDAFYIMATKDTNKR